MTFANPFANAAEQHGHAARFHLAEEMIETLHGNHVGIARTFHAQNHEANFLVFRALLQL